MTVVKKKLTDAILGFVVSDALGVPVEFMTREQLDADPVVDMRGFGTHNQPPGTWSDDTSMTLATIEAFNHYSGNNPARLAMLNFENWLNEGLFTPYGKVFDVGNTTRKAILRFSKTSDEKTCGCSDIQDNGNGALMRMLPLAFLNLPIEDKLIKTREFAALTHSHELNLTACEFFVKLADNLICRKDDWLKSAYSLIQLRGDPDGIFDRIPNIECLPRSEIRSTGYVIDTLEAVLWCLLTTDSYKSCVLKAVNLGDDTDTVAAIAGGLAGIIYGKEAIPEEWLSQIARLDYISELCEAAEKWVIS